MTSLTVLIIKTNGDNIKCEASGPCRSEGPQKGKYCGWITLYRSNRPHISPLLSTEYIYDTPAKAIDAMEDIARRIREEKN